MDAAVVRFEPRGAAAEMMRRHDKMIVLSGAAGTGKSVPAMMKLHLVCLQVPRVRCLVVRKTLTSLTASTLVSFREKVAAEALSAGLLRFYGGSQQEPASYKYSNGSVLVMGGCDKATAFLSTDYDLCFADEAIELTAEDIEVIDTRLRNGRLPYQQFLMATNPGPPTHLLKAMERDRRLVILYSKHEDNPLLYDRNRGEWTERGRTYIERLDGLSGVRYHRLRWGRWSAAEGLVYEDWDESTHLIDWFRPPDSWTRWYAVDYGFVNPMVVQRWAEDGDGKLYLYRENYFTHRTVAEFARDVLADVGEPDPSHPRRWLWHEPKPRAVVCDHDAEGRVVLSQELNIGTIPAKKGVTDGIQALQGRLKPSGDGKPRLFIMRDALVARDQSLVERRLPTCTAEEIPAYIWQKAGATAASQAPKEVPLKQDDHGADAARYLCAEREIGAPRIRGF